GGTSAGTPSFAAIVALINQETNSAAGQGNVNYVLYPLDASYPDAFHDITTGSNDVPCEAGSVDCPNSGKIGYSAGAGYDLVTGLGSLDVSNLVTEWKSFVPASSQGANFQLSVSPASLTIASGASGSAALTVTAINGFSGSVDFSCTVATTLPGATCAVSPTSVTAGSATPVTLTVTIPAASTSFPKFEDVGWWAAGVLLALVLIFLGRYSCRPATPGHENNLTSFPGERMARGASRVRGLGRTFWGARPMRASRGSLIFFPGRRRPRLAAAIALALLCFVVASLSCSGGSSVSSPASTTTTTTTTSTTTTLQIAPVSSTVTVTGTSGTSSASLSHSALLSVTEN
ncbi:MAG: hypothetical protein ACRD3O_09050, partial [Terriglobia bacterium]